MDSRKIRIRINWNYPLLISACLLCLASEISAMQDITATGSWSLTIDVNDLQGTAGSNLNSSYESITNQVEIDVSGIILPTENWRVDVRKSDIAWSGNFQLSIVRTGDGTGIPVLSGISEGTVYQEVTDTAQSFFEGFGNRNAIPIQLKIDNVSVAIPAEIYSTTVIYTIVAI